MDEDNIVYIDVFAQRLAAFAQLATTIVDINDEEIRSLGIQMLEKTIESCTIPKSQTASLSVVK